MASHAVTGALSGAAGGAAIGSVVPGIGTVAGGVVGGLAGLFGGLGGDAAENAAQAQLDAQIQLRQQALGYAAPTQEELWGMNQQVLQLQQFGGFLNQEYARNYSVLNSIQPGVMEAAQQTVAALRGQDTRFLDPIKRQREQGRAELQAQLQNQMGSGYAASSAGQAALARYDQQTSNVMQQGQLQGMQTLASIGGQLQGIGTQSSAQFMGAQGMQNSMLGNALASRSNIQSRQIAALTGTSITPYAGAQYAGDFALANALGKGVGTLAGIGLGKSLASPGQPGSASNPEVIT